MNKKAQFELNPIGIFMGVVGGILGYVMAGGMDVGIIMRIFVTLATMIACYFISSSIINK